MQTAKQFWESLMPVGETLSESQCVAALEAFQREAVLAEREGCAKLADEFEAQGDWDVDTAHCIAASIRTRTDDETERQLQSGLDTLTTGKPE